VQGSRLCVRYEGSCSSSDFSETVSEVIDRSLYLVVVTASDAINSYTCLWSCIFIGTKVVLN